MLPCQEDNRSFFEKLQKAEGLDLRDNRGKRHELAVVLVGVTIALLSNRDGCLSSIQRHLKKHYEKLVLVLGVEKKRAVSRSQLPLILEKVSVAVFDQLLFENYGIGLSQAERKWFAIDGKELRGSIESGNKRGEAVVQAVAHAGRQVAAQDYYSGAKESEVPRVAEVTKRKWFSVGEDKFRRAALQGSDIGTNDRRRRQILGRVERESKTIEKADQSGNEQSGVFIQNTPCGKRTRANRNQKI
jgi:hypothetical protein